jgi:hypothetical protein
MRFNYEKNTAGNTVYTSCGFQSNLQVQSSLARAVTVDNELSTNSRPLHTLTVGGNFKKCKLTMTGYEKLIEACDKSIDFYTNHLTKLRKFISLQEEGEKILTEINPKTDLSDFQEIHQFNNFNGYLTISLLELSVICKNLCLAKTDWEKAFFIKHGFMIIHETIKKIKPNDGISYVQQTIDSKYPLLKDRFHKALDSIDDFKIKNNYKKIETTRHFTAGHIEKSLKKYYDTIMNLDGEEAAKCINDFLKILNEFLDLSKDYAIQANKIQSEKRNEIDEKLKNTFSMINDLLNKQKTTANTAYK